jgi:hypothetical protein
LIDVAGNQFDASRVRSDKFETMALLMRRGIAVKHLLNGIGVVVALAVATPVLAQTAEDLNRGEVNRLSAAGPAAAPAVAPAVPAALPAAPAAYPYPGYPYPYPYYGYGYPYYGYGYPYYGYGYPYYPFGVGWGWGWHGGWRGGWGGWHGGGGRHR